MELVVGIITSMDKHRTRCYNYHPVFITKRKGLTDMAKLHKLTVYICDLEENLTMDEIETLIAQDALDGCAINCVTHFANQESVDTPIEWDDDIDLNYLDSTTEQWEAYFKKSRKKEATN
jgi:hypothetical protein